MCTPGVGCMLNFDTEIVGNHLKEKKKNGILENGRKWSSDSSKLEMAYTPGTDGGGTALFSAFTGFPA